MSPVQVEHGSRFIRILLFMTRIRNKRNIHIKIHMEVSEHRGTLFGVPFIGVYSIWGIRGVLFWEYPHIYIYIYICICLLICLCICICNNMYTYMCVYMYTHIQRA